MFEAVFILTAVDTGTRVGRFFLQEMIGLAIPKFNEKHWWPGIISTSAIFTFAWGYLVYTGDISTIWPLFGMENGSPWRGVLFFVIFFLATSIYVVPVSIAAIKFNSKKILLLTRIVCIGTGVYFVWRGLSIAFFERYIVY